MLGTRPLTITRATIFDDCLQQLVMLGYQPTPMVLARGEFSRRGAVVDVYPVNHTHPIRIEFEDQAMVRLQSFEVSTQRSVHKNLVDVLIHPYQADEQLFFMSASSVDAPGIANLLSDLRPGNPVVHVFHGIGIFQGLKYMRLGPLEGEFLHIKYKGSDQLYVPLNQLAHIHAYVGPEGPTIYHLSDTRWLATLDKVRAQTENIAQDLLELYRQRHLQTGVQYNEDSAWQIQLEASFPFADTPDQRSVSERVKRDMEAPHPMDRLLCGDVGFGKTEIAIRAAFKAAEAGRQVAILVPTTVLAQQHYRNFHKRLQEFGVRVEVLSRFQTKGQHAKIIAGLKDGSVDLVIGTHRLLQSDVGFKQLGLLIIDEEQRFGVMHKERLKQLHPHIDVLTMTATPIPRTLYLSLTGTRDLSVLETAPQKRLPIRTVVATFSLPTIQKAIRAELTRKGQVYFLHPRIEDIEGILQQVQSLVPEARLGLAHGRMSARALEKVMLDFLEGRVDVLVCTTIIENGLDVPNANTIVINEAERYGLSQIHQLRGRVGRSERQGEAYLLCHAGKILAQTSQERLQAIREYTALGSGYRLALKDLEFRGAGNMLGTAQSGAWADVGIQLYMDILNESIALSRGQGRPNNAPVTPLQLSEGVKNFIPDDYIADVRERLAIYERLMASQRIDDVTQLMADLLDRYGKLPAVVQRLLTSIAEQLKPQDTEYHDAA